MTAKKPETSSIEAAERDVAMARDILAGLLEQRRLIEQTQPAREAELASISYSAIVLGNPAAKTRLGEIHALAAKHGSELAAIDAATAEARNRLAGAEARVERESERDNARAVLQHYETLKSDLLQVDEAAKALAAAYQRAEVSHRAIVRAGCEKIGHQTFWAMVQKSVKWTLHALPAVGEFQAPNGRVDMPKLAEVWGATFRGWAAQRLGDGPIDDELEPVEIADAAE